MRVENTGAGTDSDIKLINFLPDDGREICLAPHYQGECGVARASVYVEFCSDPASNLLKVQ